MSLNMFLKGIAEEFSGKEFTTKDLMEFVTGSQETCPVFSVEPKQDKDVSVEFVSVLDNENDSDTYLIEPLCKEMLSLDLETKPIKEIISEDEINKQIDFYKKSLKIAGERINNKKKSKSLKDVIGKEYEEHRKRIWEFAGFSVDKNKNGSAFNVDWSIYYNDKLVAIEEDKGHYVDSCFLERCIGSFIKTINNFNKKDEKCPYLILSSFTKYSKYEEKLKEGMGIFKKKFCKILKEKIKYNYLNNNDRFSKDLWFQSTHEDINNPYEVYNDKELIKQDIEFMLSLKN